MNTIRDFLNKWGLIMLVIFTVLTFFNTCGVKTKLDSLNKKVQTLEKSINYNDSINIEINSIEREISNIEVAREVLYTNNAIVRTVQRPDDVMNAYNKKIKDLQEKLKIIKNARR